jgi:hypothetical protein
MKTRSRLAIALALVMSVVAGTTFAATFSSSYSAPTVDGADMANLGYSTSLDKWFVEDTAAGDPKGQSFTTTQPIVLNAISYRVGSTSMAEPTKVYIVRLGVISGTSFYEVYREQATQSASWATNQYATWTFTTPPTLYSNVTYGIDVGMKSSTSGWATGIPYLQYTTGGFAGGSKYYSPRPSPWVAGEGTAVAVFDSANDRIFHLDATATTITDTTAPTLTNIVDSVAGGPIYADRVKLVYTLYFNESINASTIGLADFENAGSGVTLTSVESVTQIAGPHPFPSTITMVVGVSGTGTLQTRSSRLIPAPHRVQARSTGMARRRPQLATASAKAAQESGVQRT